MGKYQSFMDFMKIVVNQKSWLTITGIFMFFNIIIHGLDEKPYVRIKCHN